MKHMNIDVTKKPTEQQQQMLKEAASRPITFDEDCPELTDSQLKQFRRVSHSSNTSKKNMITADVAKEATSHKKKFVPTTACFAKSYLIKPSLS